MKIAYVLMYKKAGQFEPYAVFEDGITAERMKRPGDEIAVVPFIRNDCPPVLKADDKLDLKNVSVTYSGTEPWQVRHVWDPENSSVRFDLPSYPKVTCDKTVDEHKWTNRSD